MAFIRNFKLLKPKIRRKSKTLSNDIFRLLIVSNIVKFKDPKLPK